MTYTFKTNVWLYSGAAAWHFASVPKKESEKIKEKRGKRARGWGSLPVTVTLKNVSWETSIFPDKKSGQYLLPLKLDVRKKTGVADGDTIRISLTL